MMVKCEARFCEVRQDVQYLVVRDNTGEFVKEHYCQEHLRKRIHMLELVKTANKIREEIKGW